LAVFALVRDPLIASMIKFAATIRIQMLSFVSRIAVPRDATALAIGTEFLDVTNDLLLSDGPRVPPDRAKTRGSITGLGNHGSFTPTNVNCTTL